MRFIEVEVEVEVEGAQRTRWFVTQDGAALSVDAVLDAWASDPSFVDAFAGHLAACPFTAVFFETPPVVASTLDRRFEFVLVDAPALARRQPNPGPFRHALAEAELAATFANLGKDAVLVAPTERGADGTHLAAFSRTADPVQQRALWAAVAAAMRDAIGTQPRWLSSSGLGVSWLHLRIDSRPKYYTHRPYRDPRSFGVG